MPNGSFLPLHIPFSQNGAQVPAHDQAEEILKKATDLTANGSKSVAITYSANYGQTRDIQKIYFAGGWLTNTSGANQAEVMRQMEILLDSTYAALQGKMHIVPITTLNAYTDPVSPWNDDVLMGIIITDLARIEMYLESGWDVLGWQNQSTVSNPQHPYAIGGGVVKLPTAINEKIQSTLIGYAKKYAP